jgi:hypothetical protein
MEKKLAEDSGTSGAMAVVGMSDAATWWPPNTISQSQSKITNPIRRRTRETQKIETNETKSNQLHCNVAVIAISTLTAPPFQKRPRRSRHPLFD